MESSMMSCRQTWSRQEGWEGENAHWIAKKFVELFRQFWRQILRIFLFFNNINNNYCWPKTTVFITYMTINENKAHVRLDWFYGTVAYNSTAYVNRRTYVRTHVRKQNKWQFVRTSEKYSQVVIKFHRLNYRK